VGIKRTADFDNPPFYSVAEFFNLYFHSAWPEGIFLKANVSSRSTMGDVTKTLELKLVDPNTHKEHKLPGNPRHLPEGTSGRVRSWL